MEGGQEIWVDAPLERMPLFVRAGSVLPMQEVVQHSDEQPPGPLILRVYPPLTSPYQGGESTALLWERMSWLYEDDGHSLGYRRGEYRLTRFTCRAEGNSLSLSRAVGGDFTTFYPGFEIQVYMNQSPREVTVDGTPLSGWEYAEEKPGHMPGLLRFRIGEWKWIRISY